MFNSTRKNTQAQAPNIWQHAAQFAARVPTAVITPAQGKTPLYGQHPRKFSTAGVHGNGWDAATGYCVAMRPGGAIIDCDDPTAFAEVLRVLPALAAALTVKTRKGYHIYVTGIEDFGQTTLTWGTGAGENAREFLSLRAWPNYCIGPGSQHPDGGTYDVMNEGEAGPYPLTPEESRALITWIKGGIAATKDKPTSNAPKDAAAKQDSVLNERARRYAKKAIAGCALNVHKTSEGQRNNALHRAGLNAFSFVKAGMADEADTFQALLSAGLATGLSEAECTATIKSAMASADPSYATTKWENALTRGREWDKAAVRHGEAEDGAGDDPDATGRSPKKKGDSLYADILAASLSGSYTYDGQAWRKWVGTHWAVVSDPRMELDTLAERAILRGEGEVKASRIDSVLRLTAHAGRLGREFTPRPDLVPFQNGTLEVATGRLRPHDKADNLTYCLPYNYDPSAKWDTIRRVLTENMPDPLAVAAYMGHIGLALLGAGKDGQGRRAKNFHKALVLIGTRGSGKSTLLDLANMVLGQPEGDHLPAKVFDTDNRAANLRAVYLDRPLATIDEFPETALHDGATEDQFKTMCAGGQVAAWQPFGRQKVNAVWRPKMILATNNPPMLTDHSRALERRLVFIECPNYRPDSKARNVLADCEAELSGFAAACIEMARRINAAGVYPESDAMAALKRRIFTAGSNIKQFLAEQCEVTGRGTDRVATSTLYAAYKSWVKAQGGHEMTHARMTNAIEMAAGEMVRLGTYDNLPCIVFDELGLKRVNKRARGFAGLRLREAEEYGEGEAARAEGQPERHYWLSGLLDDAPEPTPPAPLPPAPNEAPSASAPSAPSERGGHAFSTEALNAQAAAALAVHPELDLGDCTVTDIDGLTYPDKRKESAHDAGEAVMTVERFVELVKTALYALRATAAHAELTGDSVTNRLDKDEFRRVWQTCPPDERPALAALVARVPYWSTWAGRLMRADRAEGVGIR